jgi:hypothetical protein
MAADAQAPTEVLVPEVAAVPQPPVPVGDGIRLSAHPRARRHIAIAKGWGGLLAFLLVLKLSRGAALPWPDAIERALVGGIVGYLTLWMIAQTIWRHIALAELEDLRKRLVAKAQAQQSERERLIAEAEAERAAAEQRAVAAAAAPTP